MFLKMYLFYKPTLIKKKRMNKDKYLFKIFETALDFRIFVNYL